MKNQGGETKAAPRPSRTSSGMGLEEGDSPEAAAPAEGGETSGGSGGSAAIPWSVSGWVGAWEFLFLLVYPALCRGR